ncbi:hypothetical protein BCR44DRAFT_1253758 [Catenaria anguillulae PL171]|uniref:Uncharacterized protein n=1 Tax=Catenaria anguillulae PL171 TaxID=765915 RepID=A0A1Y2HBU0_9FUNG|nr:hypothetical protein BCR44DRAFT_1253758 [Catenaria anguillulae PL171]
MNVSLSMIPSATNGTSSPTTVTSLLWAIPVSAIHPDLPADMGNRPMFFAIHIVALACISLSMLGSLSVLLHHLNYPVPKAVSRWTGGMFRAYGEPAGSDQVTVAVKPSGRSGAAAGNAHHGTMGGQSKTVKAGIRRDFSSRFAFYLALADFLWSMAHSIDHLVLLVSGRFPDDATSMKLAIVVFVFFGGQQMMHFCLSLYTYIRVVRGVNFDLGAIYSLFHMLTGSLLADGLTQDILQARTTGVCKHSALDQSPALCRCTCTLTALARLDTGVFPRPKHSGVSCSCGPSLG